MGKVQLIGYWRSRFSCRVEIALKFKGIEFEYVEEDLQCKTRSEQLLKYNPIHKKVPILVHDGKPIVESLLILEYIHETWKENPLLPSDPYERAQARFWAKFVDDKIFPAAQIALLKLEVDEGKAKEELSELLEIFENEIKEGKILGGKDVGYLDIVALLIGYWVPILQEALGEEVLTRDKFPQIFNWCDELLENHKFIKQNLPCREKMISSYRLKFAKV